MQNAGALWISSAVVTSVLKVMPASRKTRGATAEDHVTVQEGDFLGSLLFGGSDGDQSALANGARLMSQG